MDRRLFELDCASCALAEVTGRESGNMDNFSSLTRTSGIGIGTGGSAAGATADAFGALDNATELLDNVLLGNVGVFGRDCVVLEVLIVFVVVAPGLLSPETRSVLTAGTPSRRIFVFRAGSFCKWHNVICD